MGVSSSRAVTSVAATVDSWRNRLELWVTTAWYGRGPGLLWCLLPLNLLFRALVAMRRWRYRHWPAKANPLPVVIVGGITVGGTGKTPVLLALYRALSMRGLSVGVVSRGYGSTVADSPMVVDATARATDVGDEPLLLARAGCTVVVCQQRAQAVAYLAQHTHVQVVLSDDGLQHYRMARDFEIAVLDNKRRVGNGWMLPMGPLREPVTRLDEVDWLLLRNGDEPDTGFRYRPCGFYHYGSAKELAIDDVLDNWSDKRVLAATGLGQPEQFFEVLEMLGLSLQRYRVPDHAPLDTTALARYDADVIVVTEKDAVKVALARDSGLAQRLWILRIEALLPDGVVNAILHRLNAGATA